MPWTKAFVFFLLTTAVTPGVIGEESSTENLRRLLTDRFSTNRHHSANPEFKEATRVFLTDTFQSYGLHVTLQNFTSDRTGYQGENIIGTLSGRFTGTPADMPVLLAAHYDTMPDTPGVDDNGSGLAALLESARLITSQPCKLTHSVIFVAFDFEEYGKEGSTVYVRNILVPYLTQNGIPLADFQGAISMDTLMNYNNSEGVQYVPSEFGMVPDPDNMYNNVAADGFRGNFLGVVGRKAHDARLYSPFLQTWNGTAQYRTVSMLLPMRDVYQDGPSDPFWPVYRELLRSDHASFWRENTRPEGCATHGYGPVPRPHAAVLPPGVRRPSGGDRGWAALPEEDHRRCHQHAAPPSGWRGELHRWPNLICAT
ncbi:uncharacterized protein YfbL-like [Branchiostoma floridae x Branchiostoma japonicum]